MARTKQIDFRRVTFSFPADVLEDLRTVVDKNNMSHFVTTAVKKQLLREKSIFDDARDFADSLKLFRKEAKSKTSKNTLQILREIRYGGKY